MNMKKTFNFGKVDYLNHGRKDCAVDVTIELNDTNDGPEFTASGNIWNARHTDIYSGGQNLDTIAKHVHGSTFKKIYRLWALYHLNALHPECEHQRVLSWVEQAHEVISSFAFTPKDDVDKKVRAAKRRAIDCLRAGESFTPTEEETKLAVLPDMLILPEDKLPDDLAAYYKPDIFILSRKHEKQERRGQVRFQDDPRGILCKPCPVCGYKYGTAWKYMPIHDKDMQIIKALFAGKEAI